MLEQRQRLSIFGEKSIVCVAGMVLRRHMSGSIESVSPTSSGHNLAATLAGVSGSSADAAASVGTWKLIKGKVSQTIEDIKSSKGSAGPTLPAVVISSKVGGETHHDLDSDVENAPSLSEELSLHEQDSHRSHSHSRPSSAHRGDSDSDIENELLLDGGGSGSGGDVERSRLRRGIANLKSKVKAKSASHHHRQPHQAAALSTAALSTATISTAISNAAIKTMKREPSPSASAPPTVGGGSGGATLRSTFMRKRRRQVVEGAEPAEQATGTVTASELGARCATSAGAVLQSCKKLNIVSCRKDVEIESGVEMLEDMVYAPTAHDGDSKSVRMAQAKRKDLDLMLENFGDVSPSSMKAGEKKASASQIDVNSGLTLSGDIQSAQSRSLLTLFATAKTVPVWTVVAFGLVLVLPIHDFIRGVLVCLMTIALLEYFWATIEATILRYLATTPPEKTTFAIPDYTKMSICRIPSVEEHKTVKVYAGWMNEVNSYDPSNFHITMSKSVYVKLEGTMMRISSTTARVPKRVMWNEVPIDHRHVVFLEHRTYNLLGSRLELLPLGLAKKRYFNRKYPIQLIIRNCPQNYEEPSFMDSISKRPSSISVDNNDAPMFDAKDVPTKPPSMLSAQSSSVSQLGTAADLLDDRSSERSFVDVESELDFAGSILSADLQALHDVVSSESDLRECAVPCGDEVRLLLFARGDREKEDWYRRFLAASTGAVHDQDLQLTNIRMVTDEDVQVAATKAALQIFGNIAKQRDTPNVPSNISTSANTDGAKTPSGAAEKSSPVVHEDKSRHIKLPGLANTPDKDVQEPDGTKADGGEGNTPHEDTFEGLLMNSSVARNPVDYIRFMALYQSACRQNDLIPVRKRSDTKIDITQSAKRQKRAKQQEDELWKGIDQSLFLGPSGSVVWANVLVGRILFSCLHDAVLHGKIKEFLQKKLSSIKLPSFMEDVVITQINLGETPPMIHRISQPVLDERGTWLDADITYEGHLDITVTTKLNLLRLKRQTRPHLAIETPVIVTSSTMTANVLPDDLWTPSSSSLMDDQPISEVTSGSAIFDSDAESTGGSSSESESPVPGTTGEPPPPTGEFNVFNSTPGNARRIFKIVDRFTASNFFQYATELSYVQRAMENMSANITLKVELKGMVARGTVNIPPPPSDRVWLSFRGPPRLWISAKPAVGDKSFDWSVVTNIIESKLCEEVNKFLVYPNMVDLTIPFLGQPTYTE